jgi:hypothetical protein
VITSDGSAKLLLRDSGQGLCAGSDREETLLFLGALGRRPDDGDWAGGVQRAVHTDRPQEGAGEATPAAVPHHEQVGPVRLFDKHAGRRAQQ